MSYTVRSEALSDRGLVRQTNQDAFINDSAACLWGVADGMGGNVGGDIASQYTIQLVRSIWKNFDPFNLKFPSLETWWIQTTKHICLRLYEYALERPQYQGMGTTLSLISYHPMWPNKCWITHVGDSRIYWMRSGFLYQVTKDHSLVSEKIQAGILRRDDPMIKSMRNILTRSLGHQEDEEIDVTAIDIQDQDLFLICSDGLSNKVPDPVIHQALLNMQDMAETCSNLVNLANQNGGEDNITIVIGRIEKS